MPFKSFQAIEFLQMPALAQNQKPGAGKKVLGKTSVPP
jgi:hypothetical protein